MPFGKRQGVPKGKFISQILIMLSNALVRTQLVKITVREFLDDILNTNSMQIIVR